MIKIKKEDRDLLSPNSALSFGVAIIGARLER